MGALMILASVILTIGLWYLLFKYVTILAVIILVVCAVVVPFVATAWIIWHFLNR